MSWLDGSIATRSRKARQRHTGGTGRPARCGDPDARVVAWDGPGASASNVVVRERSRGRQTPRSRALRTSEEAGMAARAMRRVRGGSIVAGLLVAFVAGPASAARVHRGAARLVAVHHDSSRALRDITPAPTPRTRRIRPVRRLARPAPSGFGTGP